jgi:UDP-3-O-[3-hydroxymyristoyl] glucosamine N-acyltransferase
METIITGAASVEEAGPGDLVFAESPRFLASALRSHASAVLTSSQLAEPSAAKPLVLVSDPRLAFVQVLEMFAPPLSAPPGIDPTAKIGAGTVVGAEVRIGAYVTIGEGVTLGDRVALMAGTRVGNGCVIGEDTLLYPNVVFYPYVRVGKRCIFHSGSIIGADGFGYVPVGYALKKVPQLGVVEIGDEVEVGANSCIDRAKTGATVIGSGTKIDNLVHVAHNVRIGQSCLLIAQVGIAGSTTLGNGVIMAGQSGVRDNVTLGDGVRVSARGGVIGNVPPGTTVSGFPARPHQEKMREFAAAAALPDYIKRVRALEKRLEELEARLSQPSGADS